jgi:hypothetical protein
MYFRDCKTLSVFERKIPLTFSHKPRYCEKEKDKANKRILRSLSFDNNG